MIYRQKDSLTYCYCLTSIIVVTLNAWPNSQGFHALPKEFLINNDTLLELITMYRP